MFFFGVVTSILLALVLVAALSVSANKETINAKISFIVVVSTVLVFVLSATAMFA